MHNPPLSTGAMLPGYGITGIHVHPKAKSNDMMIINGPSSQMRVI